MSRPKTPVRFTGQHFTINKQLISDIIDCAKINHKDTVIDIGAGKGYLTIHLSKVCKKVIAIEKDMKLAKVLENNFSTIENVDVVRCDFRNFIFPNKPFKVVSNIPYGITSDIFKTLMFQQAEIFNGGTIVCQLEAAEKLFTEELYNPYTILFHTYFDLSLICKVPPDNFIPPPTVMSALLQIRKKRNPKFHYSLRNKYLNFLFFFLKMPQMHTKTALKRLFRKKQVRGILEKYTIDPKSNITRLKPNEWANCFRELLDKVPEKYHPQ